MTRAAAPLLLQLGDKGGQCIQLNGELLNQRAHAERCRVPVTVCDDSGSGVHLKQSLPEIQLDGDDLSKPAVQIRLDTTPERIQSSSMNGFSARVPLASAMVHE